MPPSLPRLTTRRLRLVVAVAAVFCMVDRINRDRGPIDPRLMAWEFRVGLTIVLGCMAVLAVKLIRDEIIRDRRAGKAVGLGRRAWVLTSRIASAFAMIFVRDLIFFACFETFIEIVESTVRMSHSTHRGRIPLPGLALATFATWWAARRLRGLILFGDPPAGNPTRDESGMPPERRGSATSDRWA